MTEAHHIDQADGITIIDSGYQRERFDAFYLVREHGEAAFIDSGTSYAVPRAMAALESHGLSREQVRWVIVTHVHLDHAGGAGALMRELPNARLVVHPRGAPHMIDPSKLIAGSTAIYGEEEMKRSYGEIVPVDAARVVEMNDGERLDLNGRPLRFLDTPGHALHHFCVFDERHAAIFTGDTYGFSYREFDTGEGPCVFPTTTPVQLDPAAFHDSVDRLMALEPSSIYLTHFGRITPTAATACMLHDALDAFTRLAIAAAEEPEARREEMLAARMLEWMVERLRSHGVTLPQQRCRELLALDAELNAQGYGVWLSRMQKKAIDPATALRS